MRARAHSACGSLNVSPFARTPKCFAGVNDQSAPAAANVEQTLAGTKAQFAAEIIEFALLRYVEFLGL